MLQLPIEHHPAATVVGQTSEPLSREVLDVEFPQQLSRPDGIIVRFMNKGFVERFAARLQHERVIRPHLEQLHLFRLGAEQTGRCWGVVMR